MRFSSPAQFRAYAVARAEAAAAHLDPVEAAKFARAAARLPLFIVATTRVTVAQLLDAVELPEVPEVTAEESSAILESLAA